MKIRILAVFMILMGVLSSHGDMVEEDAVRIAAQNWIAGNAVFQAEPVKRKVSAVKRLHKLDGREQPLWQVDLQPSGYLVMASDDTLPPVVAFDTTGKLNPFERKTLNLMLETQGAIYERALSSEKTRGGSLANTNQIEWGELLGKTRASSIIPSIVEVEPLLTTEWSQRHPSNYFCPSATSHCVKVESGCVMVAMAQVMKYYEWPVAGKGIYSWDDVDGMMKSSMQADLSFPYDWSLLSDYYGTGSLATTRQEIALGRLCMDLGVLKQADYESNGTAAWDYDIGEAMTNYLGYAQGISYCQWMYEGYDYMPFVDWETMRQRLRRDLLALKPVIVGYLNKDYSGAHCFVADGLAEHHRRDYYHFNYGWGGTSNGWYLLTDGYDESIIYSCITGISPLPVPVFKEMAKEQPLTFTLTWHFPKHVAVKAFRLLREDALHNTAVVDSEISGESRSYTVSEEKAGLYSYVLQALVNGTWQDCSEAVTITVKENPLGALTLTAPLEIKNFDGKEVSFNISANHDLAAVSVFCHRPELLAGPISASGKGKSWTVRMQPKSGVIGNLLLEITAADAVGSIARQMTSVSFLTNQWMSELVGGGSAVGWEEASWMTGLDAKWTVQNKICRSGSTALQSGTLRRGVTQRSELGTSMTGPARVIFHWKVQAEEKIDVVYGALDFFIDGKQYSRISGDTDWCRRSYSINDGEHLVDWICLNLDYANTVAKGWVDDVQCFPLRREGEFEYYVKDEKAYISVYGGTVENLVVPDKFGGYPVAGIDDGAFAGRKTLKSVELPETVSFIGRMAFDGCDALERLLLTGPPCEFGEYSIPESTVLYVREAQGWREDTLGDEYTVVIQYPVNVNGNVYCYAEEGATVGVGDVQLPENWHFIRWTCEEYDMDEEMAHDRNMQFIMPNSTVSLTAEVSYALLLHPGWNLIAFQIKPQDEMLRKLANYDPMTYVSKSYSVANKLVAGEGYWLFNRQKDNVTVDIVGEMLTMKPSVAPRMWQLVGIMSDMTLGELRQGDGLQVWQWAGGMFRLMQDDTEILKGGQAYWMFAE